MEVNQAHKEIDDEARREPEGPRAAVHRHLPLRGAGAAGLVSGKSGGPGAIHALGQRQDQLQKSKPHLYLQTLGIHPHPIRSMQLAWGGVDPVSVVQP